jgi:hypothetical protein
VSHLVVPWPENKDPDPDEELVAYVRGRDHGHAIGFHAGGAVAFGLMGMAQAIHENEKWRCPHCRGVWTHADDCYMLRPLPPVGTWTATATPDRGPATETK